MILNVMLNFDIFKRFWETCVKICSSLVTLEALGLYFISNNKIENNTELLKIYKFSFKILKLNGDIKKNSPSALEMILGKKYFALIFYWMIQIVRCKFKSSLNFNKFHLLVVYFNYMQKYGYPKTFAVFSFSWFVL